METSHRHLFSHAATILPVDDVLRSITFYQDQLGFTLTFSWGQPVDYAVLNRDDAVSIHLSKRMDGGKPSDQHIVLYVFVMDVDAVYQEYRDNRVDIATPIGNREYQMRDFDIRDPDGHLISFGKYVEP